MTTFVNSVSVVEILKKKFYVNFMVLVSIIGTTERFCYKCVDRIACSSLEQQQ